MSYLTQEQSVEVGQPVELYRLFNNEEIFTYTSGQTDYVYVSETYVPRPISRTEDRIESLNSQRDIVLKLPSTDEFVVRYVSTVPSQLDQVRIYRLHTTDGGSPEVVQIFAGTVSNVAITKNNEASINCRSYAARLDLAMPRQTCRALCNHVLYDSRCKVDNSDFTLIATVQTISSDGLTITVSSGAAVFPFTGLQLSAQLTADASFLLGGVIERGGLERRMIRTSSNLGGNLATFTVLLPFATLEVGSNVSIMAGCDHQRTTCAVKFVNIDNYGGFPWIPTKNPFEVGIDV